MVRILGIETSCDETAAAVVCDHPVIQSRILGNALFSQIKNHAPYGGVVPELAARAHLLSLPDMIQQALTQSQLTLQDLDAIAVTAGPGLMGGVLVGVMTAKAMAMGLNKPFLAINHLEGHALTPRLTHDVAFPYLLLLASGGHCQFLLAHDVGHYQLLGQTIDDAAGEAFDKVASCLGLPYPGGPTIEQRALTGDPLRFSLPRPLKGKKGCDLSFSGLKTATRLLIEKESPLDEQTRADIAASFQYTVAMSLNERLNFALEQIPAAVKTVVLSGGVAANQFIRKILAQTAEKRALIFVAPPLSLCTDNAAMIAWAACERFKRGQRDGLDFMPRPRWPLTTLERFS